MTGSFWGMGMEEDCGKQIHRQDKNTTVIWYNGYKTLFFKYISV